MRRRGERQSRRYCPYRKRESLLTRGELAFFWILRKALAGRYGISFKTRLADVVLCPEELWETIHGRRLSQKHIDFVLYDPRDLSIILAIELDDVSHSGTERRRRDQFIDSVFRDVGLPLLRVKAAFRYDVSAIRQMISAATLVGTKSPHSRHSTVVFPNES